MVNANVPAPGAPVTAVPPLLTASANELRARRARVGEALGGQAAVVPAGHPPPRNYPANTYPFRGSSHFLYLFGEALVGAYGIWTGTEWVVYAHEPSVDDTLWHGPLDALPVVAERVGCAVHPLTALPEALPGGSVGTPPVLDARTREELGAWLARPIPFGTSHEPEDLRVYDALLHARLVHDAAAQRGLRYAAAITARAHQAGMRATRPGARESDVRAAMEAVFMAEDMTVAYGSIVTVHGEVLHNDRYGGRLASGELLLADVGGESPDGWAADVTRTWPVSGRFSTTQRELYQVVLNAQKTTIAAVKPGARYRDLHALASVTMGRGLVELGILRGDPEELYRDGVTAILFPHGIGHLIGLDVHDMEDLGDRAGYAPGRTRAAEHGIRYLRLDRDLAPGMAVTIEPGLYFVPGILESPTLGRRPEFRGRIDFERLAAFADVRGIRIEDDVLVTAGGADVLTANIPKEVSAVEAAVAGG